MTDTLLKLENINTFYGPVQAHFDLNITVGRGQIVSLLGGNASGKSTTMKIVLGLVKPASGTVTFDGQVLNGLTTPQIVRRGVGSVPSCERIAPRCRRISTACWASSPSSPNASPSAPAPCRAASSRWWQWRAL
jgi:ABC-type branched-subunit amino acid transport system ATPase component